MQNRIEELIKKCTSTFTYYSDGRGNVTESSFDKQKFAELLVKECAFVVCKNALTDDEGCYHNRKINEHFGIKE